MWSYLKGARFWQLIHGSEIWIQPVRDLFVMMAWVVDPVADQQLVGIIAGL